MVRMARKKNRNRGANSANPAMVRRNLDKGDAKAALKQAKVCFRADASHDNRELLEETYLARVEQLHRLKMVPEAKSVLTELLALKPSLPLVVEKLPRMRLFLGEQSAATEAIVRSDPTLLNEFVDQAILNGQAEIPDIDGIGPSVSAVRKALEAIERGEDAAAIELLATISRNSPVADWRLFTRGLIAYYQQDVTRAKNNWDRLDATRPGKRMARSLLHASDAAKEEAADDMAGALGRLNAYLRSDPAVSLLEKLADAWRLDYSEPFFRLFRQLYQRHFKTHEPLIRQIVDVVWKRAAREGHHEVLDPLVKIGPAPVIDPNWHRARALVQENADSRRSFYVCETEWERYAAEIDSVDGFQDAERPIAKALVYQRIGRGFLAYMKQYQRYETISEGDREWDEFCEGAARGFRKSIRAFPGLRESYFDLVSLHEQCDELHLAAPVMKKLVAVQPDNLEAATWLALYYLGQDDPGGSERYVRTVMRLRPRDPNSATLAWNQSVTMVRCLAIKRQFEAARTELEQAAKLAPADVERYTLDLLRAAIEFKERNVEVANRHVDVALSKVEEPTPIWLQLSGTVTRMRVAREYKKTFDDRFKAAIKNKPTSASAGRMAKFLYGIKATKVNYSGRATQEKLLVKYLGRARKIKWSEGDLRHACGFLEPLPRCRDLFQHFVVLGQQKFPQVPHYHYWRGVEEVAHGPWRCDMELAVESLQQSLDLHEKGPVKLAADQLAEARKWLFLVKDNQEEMSESSSSCFHGDDDDFDDDDGEFGPQPGANRPTDAAYCGAMSDQELAGLVDSMPPEVRQAMEMIAKSEGVCIEDAIRIVAGAVVEMSNGGAERTSRAATNSKKKKSRNKKNRK